MYRGIMKEMEVKNSSGLLALKNSTITQLLISLSILLLVFSWSSLSSSYYQNLHYFSTNSFHAINKNYVFLIFNGILFFLANTSAIVRPPSPSNLDDMLHKTTGPSQVETEEEFLSDTHITLEEDEETKPCEVEEVKVDHEFEHSSEGAIRVLSSIAESEDDEIDLRECCLFDDVDDGDGDGEESNGSGEEVDEIGKLSDDELNQKFEDFIRRMKEEFRIIDHQQLVLVN